MSGGLSVIVVFDRSGQQLPAMWAPSKAQPAAIALSLVRYLRSWFPTATLTIDTTNSTIIAGNTRIGTYTVTPVATDLGAVRG